MSTSWFPCDMPNCKTALAHTMEIFVIKVEIGSDKHYTYASVHGLAVCAPVRTGFANRISPFAKTME